MRHEHSLLSLESGLEDWSASEDDESECGEFSEEMEGSHWRRQALRRRRRSVGTVLVGLGCCLFLLATSDPRSDAVQDNDNLDNVVSNDSSRVLSALSQCSSNVSCCQQTKVDCLHKMKCWKDSSCCADVRDCLQDFHGFEVESDIIGETPRGWLPEEDMMRDDDPDPRFAGGGPLPSEFSASYLLELSMLKGPGGYVPAFCSKSTDDCQTAVFPGHNCHSEFGWLKVVEELEKVPERQQNGMIIRRNDLGYFILNSLFWESDLKTIGLGVSAEDHAFVRPVFVKTLGPDSPMWSETRVRKMIWEFMSGKTQLQVPHDLEVMVAIILHKIHFGLDLSEEQAADFNALRTQALITTIQPSTVLEMAPEALFKKTWCQDERHKWLKLYERHMIENSDGLFPSGLDKARLRLISSSMLDSLLFAGGTSVPGILHGGLAVLYSENSPLSKEERRLSEKSDVQKMVWEVIRTMPAVVGFSWWNPAGTERTAMALSMALRDPAVWGKDADEFRLRELWEYEAKGPVAWAQPANGPGWRDGASTSASRGCPGQKLSLVIAYEFFNMWQLVRKDWHVPVEGVWPFIRSGPGKIHFEKSVPWVSSFTLRSNMR